MGSKVSSERLPSSDEFASGGIGAGIVLLFVVRTEVGPSLYLRLDMCLFVQCLLFYSILLFFSQKCLNYV